MINNILFDFLKENKLNYFLYFISLSYIPVSKVGMPHLYGKLIGSIKKLNMDITIKYLIILIFVWFIIQIIQALSNLLYSRVLPKFNSYTRVRIIDEIIKRYQTNFKDLLVGDTITKLIKAPWVLEDVFHELESFVFSNSLVVITSFFYLYRHNNILGFLYLISMSIILYLCIIFSQSCTNVVEKSEKIFDGSHEEIEDMLSNLISVYTSNKNNFEKDRVEYLSRGIYKSEQNYYKCFNKYRILYSIVFILIFAILNIYSIKIFYEKKINVEALSAIIIINYSLLSTFMTIFYQTKRFIDLKGRLSILSTYLDNLPNLDNSSKELVNPKEIVIKIRDLGFYYIKNKYILKDISIDIKQNEKIALIGEIGSGKSTIGKLLVKLFSYDEGSIKINNIELSELSIKSLRKVITYIPQHPKLFNRTLYSNITYGISNVKRENVLKLINSINIDSIRTKFLDNLDKPVGKYGNNLSGGQRQIIWLLRSILQKSKVIILDEPTSSLDESNKKIVMDFIYNASKDKTLILITHDNEILNLVDRIIKLDKGTIINNK
jgi:ABC-type multidrug transport system fused ATPase/permease subunit